MDDEWSELEACFSNRVVNTLACRGCLIQRYTPKLETLFGNHEHLIWYKTREGLFSLIEHYLTEPDQRERIGRQGRELVTSSFTYDKAVERILRDVGIRGEEKRGNQPAAGLSRDESQFQ